LGLCGMPYCPECGGEMRYISEEDEKKRYQKEYLKWWLSKKK